MRQEKDPTLTLQYTTSICVLCIGTYTHINTQLFVQCTYIHREMERKTRELARTDIDQAWLMAN
jgi:hypothetical protein